MSKKDNFVIGLGALAVIGVIIAYYFYNDNKKKIKKIKELEEDNLKLIIDSVQKNHDLSDEIKTQLIKLVKRFEYIDHSISAELVQAIQLIQIGQHENAIEDLVKIMEHMLTKYYSHNQDFKKWLKAEKKKDDLHNKLDFCKIENKITSIEFKFFSAIKEVRNKEDHIINLQLDSYLNASGLIIGIGGIVKIAEIVYPLHKSKHNLN